jgi:hypothetical protein
MSKRINDIGIICKEKEMICFECGKIAEVRPYGPNGSEICFSCGQKNPRETKIQMSMKLFGETREQAEKNVGA